MPVKFEVLGVPVGKGRPRFSTQGGFVRAITPEKTANYETLVKLAYRQECGEIEPYERDIPLAAYITAYFPIPKSASKKKREEMLCGRVMHTHKPDCDNIVKAILDALNGIAYYDDSQIAQIHVGKYYSDQPRVEITICEEK